MINQFINGLLCLGLFAYGETNNVNAGRDEEALAYSSSVKTATVYTTARNTKLRLTKTGIFKFSKGEQARENEKTVFVNHHNSFEQCMVSLAKFRMHLLKFLLH